MHGVRLCYLFLATSSDSLSWETSERYTAWLTACHIKLGVAGAESQAFFNNINREAEQLYALVKKKDSKTTVPKRPRDWTESTITTEATLAQL